MPRPQTFTQVTTPSRSSAQGVRLDNLRRSAAGALQGLRRRPLELQGEVSQRLLRDASSAHSGRIPDSGRGVSLIRAGTRVSIHPGTAVPPSQPSLIVSTPTSPDPALQPGTPPRAAVAALVEAYGGRVYHLGLRICPTPSEAEDLVQETMVAALRSWPRYAGDAHPYTWLFRIAMRTCRRMHRKRVGEPDHMMPLAELMGLSQGSALRRASSTQAMSSRGNVAQERALEGEVRRRLDAAIARVPTVYRVALVLKDIADFSLDEIAEILEIQPATAKTRVHRGRLHLRRALDEEGAFTPLPSTNVPRQVCIDLLKAKLDAMDRGADFPFPDGELCDRCIALFRSLDLSRDVCASLREGTMPVRLRQRLGDLIEAS